jgi:hypothetical protein
MGQKVIKKEVDFFSSSKERLICNRQRMVPVTFLKQRKEIEINISFSMLLVNFRMGFALPNYRHLF